MSAMDRARMILRWLLAAIYLLAGVLQVSPPGPFLGIVPGWVPFPATVVLLTGLCEIAGAVGLMTRRWRWIAATMLALYAVCVFPANIKRAIDGLVYARNDLGWGYHGPRLLSQPVIVWWALFAGGVIDRPSGRRRADRSSVRGAPSPRFRRPYPLNPSACAADRSWSAPWCARSA
jgi:uncharacterized membrane protein